MGKRQNKKKLANLKRVMLLIATGLILIFVLFILKKCSDSFEERTYVEAVQEVNDIPASQSEGSNKVSVTNNEGTELNGRYDHMARNDKESSFFLRTINWFWRIALVIIPIAAMVFMIYTVQSLRLRNLKLSNELRNIKQKLDFTPSWSDLQGRYLEKSKFDEFVSDFENRFWGSKYNEPPEKKIGGDSPITQNGPSESPDSTEPRFFPAPTSGGYFQSSLGSKHLESGKHIFLFEFMGTKPGRAKYKVVDDRDSMEYAINYTDTILRPACEIENIMFQNPSRIETITLGEVTKENDNWKIFKKAIIRYE